LTTRWACAPRAPAGPGGDPGTAVAASRGPRREPRPRDTAGARLAADAATEWAYFFDIDGTLVELEDSVARLGPTRTCSASSRSCVRAGRWVRCALISGRSIADIDRLVRDPPAPGGGQHGIERRDGRRTKSPSRGASLRRSIGHAASCDRGRAASRIVASRTRAYRCPSLPRPAARLALRPPAQCARWPRESATCTVCRRANASWR